MRASISRYPFCNRHFGIFCLLFVLSGALPCCAIAQPPQEQQPSPIFVAPPRSSKRYPLFRIQGQTVFAPGSPKGEYGAGRLHITLFDAQQKAVATTVAGDQGSFEIKDVAPGTYTLIVGADSLQTLSISLEVQVSGSGRVPLGPGLLLHMRLKTDKRKTFVSLIANMALRADLLQRVAEDQEVRNQLIQHGVDHPDKEIEARMAAIDAENTTSMQKIVRHFGWPGPELVGVDGTEAAFLLVQHASHAVQKEMLPLVRRAYRAGKLVGQDYALLVDRVLVRDGKSQVYGTQAKPFAEWKDREPALYPIEDEAHVDKRRAEVGLFPLAEYRKMLKEMYYPQKPEKDKP